MKEARFTKRYWRDKTMFLVNAANQFLPEGAHNSMELSVYMFDFTGMVMQETNCFIALVERPLSDKIFSVVKIPPHTQERIQQCAREAKASVLKASDVIMVAGMFIDSRVVTTIFVQMQHSPQSTDGERYRVIKTVCSVVL